MNAIDLLLHRQSTPLLTEPAPSEHDLATLLAAATRVPDHGGLTPWHFHVISGQGLQRLSDLYVEANKANLLDNSTDKNNATFDEAALEEKLVKTAKMPFRAPMIIVISTTYVEHEKVPKQEQLITAGCCAHAMQMAAFSLGYGAMWRTGDLAYNSLVKKGLGITPSEEVVGFLYVGTPAKATKSKPAKNYQEKVTYWQ
jgi:nitroreductase